MLKYLISIAVVCHQQFYHKLPPFEIKPTTHITKKLSQNIFTSEFDFHWVPIASGFVPQKQKVLIYIGRKTRVISGTMYKQMK